MLASVTGGSVESPIPEPVAAERDRPGPDDLERINLLRFLLYTNEEAR
jgi:hypothetical protein